MSFAALALYFLALALAMMTAGSLTAVWQTRTQHETKKPTQLNPR